MVQSKLLFGFDSVVCVFFALFGAITLIPASPAMALQPTFEVPNFLLLLSDDLTHTDLGFQGNDDVHTPNLDGLASQSMRFTHCYNSAPMCAPTRMSLYTGIHPVRNGAHPNHSRVHDHIRSLPHHLEAAGYRCGLAGKRHEQPLANFPFRHLSGRHHDNGKGVDLEVSDVTAFITESSNRPWCLVVASNQPHTPWNRGDVSRYDGKALKLPPYMVDTPETRQALVQYDAEITYLDDQMVSVLTSLADSGQERNTVVVFLSEQGSNFPHCKWTCYDSGLRSAATVRWPGEVAPASESDAIIQYVDVVPTLLEIADVKPDGHGFDGESFLNVLKGQANSHRRYAFGIQTTKGIYHSDGIDYGIRTVRDDRYRLIWNLNSENRFRNSVVAKFRPYLSWQQRAAKGNAFAKRQIDRYQVRPMYEFYDLQQDPYEMNDLSQEPQHQQQIAEMKAELSRWMAQQGDRGAETEATALDRGWSEPRAR